MSIKCLSYSRCSTSIPIYTINNEPSNKEIQYDAQKLASKIKTLRAKVEERNKLRSSYGVWHITHDSNDIVYGVCTSQEYPQRHAFQLIAQLQAKIKEISHCEYETEENIKNFSKKTANQLTKTYGDLSKVDKVHKANKEVKELESEIGEGIKKLVDNQESLSDMGEKAEKMKSYAQEFEKNSDKLEKVLYWRNCKLKIIGALCVLGLIGFIILIIVQRTQQSSR